MRNKKGRTRWRDRHIVKITSLHTGEHHCYHCARYIHSHPDSTRLNSNNIKINSFPFIVLTFDVCRDSEWVRGGWGRLLLCTQRFRGTSSPCWIVNSCCCCYRHHNMGYANVWARCVYVPKHPFKGHLCALSLKFRIRFFISFAFFFFWPRAVLSFMNATTQTK